MPTAGHGRWAPAASWRAFFIFAAGAAAGLRAGPPQNIPPPDFAPGAPADQAAGQAILDQFRDALGSPPRYLEFDLHQLPRRGPEHLFHGRLWSSRNDQGSVMRVELNPGTPEERRFLVQTGPDAAVWMNQSNGLPQRVAPFAPLVPGVELTAFDLQMPFLYWPDFRLGGVTRVGGRPANLFLFRPPAGFAGPVPGFEGVRAFLDTQYNAPVQFELVGPNDEPLKSFSLVDLKKIGDQWIFKDLDVRNETTRDKTRLTVTAAALDLPIPAESFLPAALAAPAAPPAAGRLVRLAP